MYKSYTFLIGVSSNTLMASPQNIIQQYRYSYIRIDRYNIYAAALTP